MEESGTVTEIKGPIALVTTVAKGACHSCSARGVCHLGGEKTMVAEAWNRIGARRGDTVRIRLSSRSVLGAALLLYAVPLAALLIGFFLGQALIGHQLWALLLGFLLMAAAYAMIRVIDRWLSRAEKLRPEIVEIVNRPTPESSEEEEDREEHHG
ncbi:SoxR reducing system RseC family protein [Candidatus Zixiibacteriota bacterium]